MRQEASIVAAADIRLGNVDAATSIRAGAYRKLMAQIHRQRLLATNHLVEPVAVDLSV